MWASRGLLRVQSDGSYFEDLARPTIRALCLIGLGASWCWLFASATSVSHALPSSEEFSQMVPPLVLLAASAICLLPLRLTWRWQCVLFLVGLAVSSLLSYAWLTGTVWLYLASLVVIVAGPLWRANLWFVSALALTAGCLLLRQYRVGSYGPFELLSGLGFLWAVAVVAWLSSRSLFTALDWALHSQEQAQRLLEELRDRQGELNRTLHALTEASRRLERSNRELAIARERAEEAHALKEHFVAHVSHELRTPLNVIVGFAEMMYLAPESYQGVQWTHELESDIREMYRASRHLHSLVNDILDLARIDAARMPMFRELTNLRAIVLDAVETIAPLLRQRGLACEVECPDSLPQVFVDRTRIRQVMLNLLNNAVRFTDEGKITVSAAEVRGTVEVSVQDTGLGIPQDQLEHIFEEFRVADTSVHSRSGAGLGLALSRQFVQLHGGRMEAESEVGLGSVFRFSLPLPGAVAETTPLLHIAGRKRHEFDDAPVIVVDPDPSVADMLCRYLGDRRVLAARNAHAAEALIEGEHPLAIILNQPPDSRSEAWLGDLGNQSRRYSIPVLRCSLPSPSWLARASGLDGCLTKPVSRQELGHLLQEHGQNTRTILVVDDDPAFVRLMSRMLTLLAPEAEVIRAQSGPHALRLAGERVPDVILLDLLMPGMDGFRVLHAIRREPALAKTRVVAVTASSYGEEALRQRGGHLTLSQTDGLSTGALTELLGAILRIVRPNYAVDGRSPSSV